MHWRADFVFHSLASPFYKQKAIANARAMPGDVEIRELSTDDYDRGFLQCLDVLAPVGDVSRTEFDERLLAMTSDGNYTIVVAVRDGCVVGAGTLLVERKFIHKLALKGHIEDIVVAPTAQKAGIGRQIVTSLVARAIEKGCYKTALCSDVKNVPFYVKCGFKEKERELVIYHKN